MKVKIYVSEYCVWCEEAVRYFVQQNVEIEKVDVTYDQERFDEMVSYGGIGTPFIMIDDQIFHSFDIEKMERLLQEKRR
jgi:glutaredoxin